MFRGAEHRLTVGYDGMFMVYPCGGLVSYTTHRMGYFKPAFKSEWEYKVMTKLGGKEI